MKYFFVILLMLGTTLPSFAQETINPKFEKKIENTISKSITTISCKRLNKKLNTPNLHLLDAREKEEYEVSHLEGAKWVGYDSFDANKVKQVPKDAIVVVYCSIGYRSEKIGEQLKKMGYQRVYNLYGGIFEWSNHQFELVDPEDQKTQKVHAYNKDWGRWVEKGEKVY